jgi:ubiquinone/menaquinone biosynthesis C-methylase UbiE
MKNSMYTEHASEYAHAIKDNTYNAHYERPSFLSLLPVLKGKSILDLGCGPGEYFESFLNEKCSNITAVDLSQSMIDIVKERYGSNVNVYKQNLNMGIPKEKDSTYDLAVSALTIHYIKNIFLLFKEVHRVLKKNGFFVFSTHHPSLDFSYSKSGDYFNTEELTQTWQITGKPVEVSFYRRPLSSTFKALTEADFHITTISEGHPTSKLKSISAEDYKRLTTMPFFLFVKCRKI